jgi:hypothetical protein
MIAGVLGLLLAFRTNQVLGQKSIGDMVVNGDILYGNISYGYDMM